MLPLLASKLYPYLIGGALVFGAGCYAGYRAELPAVQAAQLRLAAQQTADAQATAVANKYAAEAQQAEAAASDAAQQARQAALGRLTASSAAMRAQIARRAAQPGQDGPLAASLAATLAGLKAEQAQP